MIEYVESCETYKMRSLLAGMWPGKPLKELSVFVFHASAIEMSGDCQRQDDLADGQLSPRLNNTYRAP